MISVMLMAVTAKPLWKRAQNVSKPILVNLYGNLANERSKYSYYVLKKVLLDFYVLKKGFCYRNHPIIIIIWIFVYLLNLKRSEYCQTVCSSLLCIYTNILYSCFKCRCANYVCAFMVVLLHAHRNQGCSLPLAFWSSHTYYIWLKNAYDALKFSRATCTITAVGIHIVYDCGNFILFVRHSTYIR